MHNFSYNVLFMIGPQKDARQKLYLESWFTYEFVAERINWF